MRLAGLALAALLLVVVALGAAGTVAATGHTASPVAAGDIPPDLLGLYARAATWANTQLACPGIDWALLAAIGKTETDHGRSTLPGVTSGENAAGAAGLMQFLAPTFNAVIAAHPPPPDGAAPPSRYSAHDAVHAAAALLCTNGATANLRAAVYAYNQSTAYVDTVLDRAAAYRATPATAPGTSNTAATVTSWPAEQASLPDPTGTGGQVTPRMNALYQTLHRSGAITGGATCWDPHPHNPESDHPRGKACDLFLDPRDPNEVARGWQIAGWLTTQQPAHGIRYLIWQGHIWTANNPTWTTYQSSVYGCPDPTNITGCHYDHIHISVY